jgi:hypothetical protein
LIVMALAQIVILRVSSNGDAAQFRTGSANRSMGKQNGAAC